MPLSALDDVFGDRAVDHDGVDRARLQRRDRVGALRVGAEFLGVDFFFDVFLAGRALLDADDQAVEVFAPF